MLLHVEKNSCKEPGSFVLITFFLFKNLFMTWNG